MTPLINKLFLSCLIALFSQVIFGEELTSTSEELQSSNDFIKITDVNMPAVPPVSRTAAIYFTLNNLSDRAVKLTNIKTDVAHHVMIHASQTEDGVAKMQHIDELTIPAKSEFKFSVGGYHIMLMGLDRNLLSKPFDVTLEFQNQPAKIFVVGSY